VAQELEDFMREQSEKGVTPTFGEAPTPDPSLESAIQLRQALLEVDAAEERLKKSDSLETLPRLAREYAEAHGRAAAAHGVVASESYLPEPERRPRDRTMVTIHSV
jgi:hypothetical protein